MKQAAGALVVLIALAGCAASPVAINTQDLRQGATYKPSPFVEVMNEPPQEPYKSIARLTVTAGPDLTADQVINALRQRAAALGANGLIVQNTTQSEAPSMILNPAGGQYTPGSNQGTQIYVGTAIRIQPSSN